jgi:hypothetical protein
MPAWEQIITLELRHSMSGEKAWEENPGCIDESDRGWTVRGLECGHIGHQATGEKLHTAEAPHRTVT